MVWITIYKDYVKEPTSTNIVPTTGGKKYTRQELDAVFDAPREPSELEKAFTDTFGDSQKISIGNLKRFNESIKRWIRLTER